MGGRELAVAFDIWGTLIDLEGGLHHLASVIAEKASLDAQAAEFMVFKSHHEARELRRSEPGLSAHELINIAKGILARNLGIDLSQVNELLYSAFTSVDPLSIVYEDVRDTLEKLNGLGAFMGLIGNVLFWESSYTRLLLERAGISRYFKLSIFSDEVGYSKPDREIFLLFSRRSGLEPDKVIYVGDNVVEDVGGALSSGMTAFLLKRDSARSFFIKELKAGILKSLRDLVNFYLEIPSDNKVR